MLTQDFTVLFAAGNDGANGYFSIGNPAMSKNCVAVGATEVDHSAGYNNDNMAFFSSIGPSFDNRYVHCCAKISSTPFGSHVGTRTASSQTWWLRDFLFTPPTLLRALPRRHARP